MMCRSWWSADTPLLLMGIPVIRVTSTCGYSDRTNADKIVQTLGDFGFGALGLTSDDFLAEEQIIQLGREPVRIDLLTGLDGVSFRDCADRAVDVDIEGVRVPFISLEDLLTNKRASGRAQDLADVEALKGIS